LTDLLRHTSFEEVGRNVGHVFRRFKEIADHKQGG
jgi:hypothetical protein